MTDRHSTSHQEADEALHGIERELRILAREQKRLSQLLEDRVLDRNLAAQYLGIAVRTLDRLRREDPRFPRPSYVANSPRWRSVDLWEYMELAQDAS